VNYGIYVEAKGTFDRVGAMQSYWGNLKTGTFGELLIDARRTRHYERCFSGC
jgi:hypothetical protein